MKRLTIQFRLAAWYFLSVAAIVVLFAAGSWFALQASMFHSIDRDLDYRMAAVVPFIAGRSLNSQEQFARVFAGSSDVSIVGVFVQVTDDESNIIYESDVLLSRHIRPMPPGPPDGSLSIETIPHHSWPLRAAGRRIVVAGVGLTVHVVEPLRDTLSSLREYALYFSLLVPLALLLTTTVGYSMSRRALAPVELIRKQADAIDPADLATRLRVPESEDELARLAHTLNAMLARIESGFRSIQQFTADASHELRAPLALIITAGDVSLRRERPRQELAETLGKIVREARRMSRLIEDLLTLARGDSGPHSSEPTISDVAVILRELCSELSPSAAAKGLHLVSSVPDHDLFARGDADDLRRLFLILIDNAIKYTEAGSISIALSADAQHVKFTVIDTGIGIEPDALPHIFDRFWRADKVRSRAEGGVGLGLALASQIAHRHAASIGVESAPGKGTAFTVLLQSHLSV